MFRASGRFIWPVFYLIVLFGIISIIRNMRFPLMILALAIFLQVVDIQPLYSSKKMNGFVHYETKLQSEFWSDAAETNKNTVLIPIPARPVYELIASFARNNHMTVNWGYFARENQIEFENYNKSVLEGLKNCESKSDTLYIFWGTEGKQLAQDYLSDCLISCSIDNFTVILSKDNRLAQSDFDLAETCSIPPH